MNSLSFLKRPAIRFYLGMVFVVAVCAYAFLGPERPSQDRNLDLRGVIHEPSGLTVHPERGTLIAVGDEGQVVEISLEGEILHDEFIGGDFEAITADPDRNLLYVVDEKAEEILTLDWDSYKVQTRISLRPFLEAGGLPRDRNDGFEGAVYKPADSEGRSQLLLGHQHHPTAILRFQVLGNPPELEYLDRIDIALPEISGLFYETEKKKLWVLCDKSDLLAEVSENGSILRKRSLSGLDQEGIALGSEGDLYIADDQGGVYRLPGLRD